MTIRLLLIVWLIGGWLAPAVLADEIHDAARNGDLARVKALIEKDPSLLTLKGRRDKHPIHWAAQGGHIAVVEYLLARGAAIDSGNEDGETPLVYAVDNNHPDLARWLLQKGAAVRPAAGSGLNPLHGALQNHFPLDIVRAIVERGADVNAVAKYRGKPLDLAIEAGDAGVVAFLKERGATASPLTFQTADYPPDVRRLSFTWGMLGNITALGGPDGWLIVDSGFHKPAAAAIRAALPGDGKIRYVLNTHDHGDHTAANTLAPGPAEVITLQSLVEGRTDVHRAEIPLTGADGKTLPAPYLLALNGQEIRIIPYPGLHSQQDMLIHFPRAKVVCMGDLLLSQSCPALGEVAAYFDFLDRVLAVFPEGTTFVGGHGRDLDKAGLRRYRADLQAMTDIVRREYTAGRKAEGMIARNVLQSYKAEYSQLDWLNPDSWIRAVVSALDRGKLPRK